MAHGPFVEDRAPEDHLRNPAWAAPPGTPADNRFATNIGNTWMGQWSHQQYGGPMPGTTSGSALSVNSMANLNKVQLGQMQPYQAMGPDATLGQRRAAWEFSQSPAYKNRPAVRQQPDPATVARAQAELDANRLVDGLPQDFDPDPLKYTARKGSYAAHVQRALNASKVPLERAEWRARRTADLRIEQNKRRDEYNRRMGEKRGLGRPLRPGDRGYKKPMPVTKEERRESKAKRERETRDAILKRRDDRASRGLAPRTRGFFMRQEEARQEAQARQAVSDAQLAAQQQFIDARTREGEANASEWKAKMKFFEDELAKGATLTKEQQEEYDRLKSAMAEHQSRTDFYAQNSGQVYPGDVQAYQRQQAADAAEAEWADEIKSRGFDQVNSDMKAYLFGDDRKQFDSLMKKPKEQWSDDDFRTMAALYQRMKKNREYAALSPQERFAQQPGLGGYLDVAPDLRNGDWKGRRPPRGKVRKKLTPQEEPTGPRGPVP